MIQILLIGLGSAVGGISRYLFSTGVYNLIGKNFPYGTLAVNTIGSFLAGFLATLLLERIETLATPLRALLIIGFLGGFTTFSSFAVETINLFESGETLRAILNIMLSFVVCLILAGLGSLLARQL
jgi:CrcB protein